MNVFIYALIGALFAGIIIAVCREKFNGQTLIKKRFLRVTLKLVAIGIILGTLVLGWLDANSLSAEARLAVVLANCLACITAGLVGYILVLLGKLCKEYKKDILYVFRAIRKKDKNSIFCINGYPMCRITAWAVWGVALVTGIVYVILNFNDLSVLGICAILLFCVMLVYPLYWAVCVMYFILLILVEIVSSVAISIYLKIKKLGRWIIE